MAASPRQVRSPRNPLQGEVPFPRESRGMAPRVALARHGGARPGAGRKPGSGRRAVRHRTRDAHRGAHPVHVVLRARFRPLRSPFVFPTLRQALAKASRARPEFRIVQFSVQSDHLHLLVEAGSKQVLSRGMQGLAIRVARAVNQLVGRTGKVWADRFFARDLTSPRAVKHALAYVLNNFIKHRVSRGAHIDPYSSAPYFTGFQELNGRAPRELRAHVTRPLFPRGVAPPRTPNEIPILAPRTWLLAEGWKRAGTLSLRTHPVE